MIFVPVYEYFWESRIRRSTLLWSGRCFVSACACTALNTSLLGFISRSYCYTVWSAIGIIGVCLSVCLSVRPSVALCIVVLTVDEGLKAVGLYRPVLGGTSYSLVRTLLLQVESFSRKRRKSWRSPKANFSSKLKISKYSCWSRKLFQTMICSYISYAVRSAFTATAELLVLYITLKCSTKEFTCGRSLVA